MIRTPVAPLTQPATEHLEYRNGTAKHVQSRAPDDGRYVSKDEYWAIWYDHPDASYEWNNGYLEAKPMSDPMQFRLYNWFLALLEQYLRVYQAADMMGLETGFSLTMPNLTRPGQLKETVRKPDLAVIRHDNPVQWGKTEYSYRGICNLCIESLSDSSEEDVERDTKVKKLEYECAGVQEYTILDAIGKHMHFYQLAPAGHYVAMLPDAEDVIRSIILPGFQFRLRDLHRQPSLEALAVDEVYQGYMLLEYQAALKQLKAARRRADKEQQRADEAQQRADEAQRRADAAAVARQLAELQRMESENARLRAELAQLRKGATGSAEGDKRKDDHRLRGDLP